MKARGGRYDATIDAVDQNVTLNQAGQSRIVVLPRGRSAGGRAVGPLE